MKAAAASKNRARSRQSDPPPATTTALGRRNQRPRRASLFLGGTFTVTWVAWGTLAALTSLGIVDLSEPAGTALLILGGSAPAWMSYVVVWRTPEEGSLREFNRRLLRFRVPVVMWLVAVLGATTLGIASMALYGFAAEVSWPSNPASVVGLYVSLLATSVAFGGLEEVGWRGVLQPAVNSKWAIPKANLVIAVVWTLWHLPLFWVVGGSHEGASFAMFLVAGIGYSSVMTWLYTRTESIALCVVFHAGINASAASGLAFSLGDAQGFAVQAVLAVTIGTVLLLVAEEVAARAGRPRRSQSSPPRA